MRPDPAFTRADSCRARALAEELQPADVSLEVGDPLVGPLQGVGHARKDVAGEVAETGCAGSHAPGLFDQF